MQNFQVFNLDDAQNVGCREYIADCQRNFVQTFLKDILWQYRLFFDIARIQLVVKKILDIKAADRHLTLTGGAERCKTFYIFNNRRISRIDIERVKFSRIVDNAGQIFYPCAGRNIDSLCTRLLLAVHTQDFGVHVKIRRGIWHFFIDYG